MSDRPLTTGEGGDATAYAWECAENMKGWALRAEESNRELRAERDRLREQLDALREDEFSMRGRALAAEAKLRRVEAAGE